MVTQHDYGPMPHISRLVQDAAVCVRNRFLGTWSTGFVVAEVLADGYRIRRVSDDLVFPDVFSPLDVRAERRHDPWRSIRSHLDRRR